MAETLVEMLQRGESRARAYNDYNRYAPRPDGPGHFRGADREIDFSQTTLGEIRDNQRLSWNHPDKLHAVGRYQMIGPTLQEAMERLNIGRNERFTPELQDRFLVDYLMREKPGRQAIHDYVTGREGVSLRGAQVAMANEWASVGHPDNGRSVYPNNHASITPAQSADALRHAREQYEAAIARGVSPDDAWRRAAGLGQQRTQSQAQPPSRPQADALSDGKLQLGERGDAVRGLQQSLKDLKITDERGQPLETRSGVYGAHTEAAVRKSQQASGLEPTGITDKTTLEAIGKQLSPGKVTAEATVTGPVADAAPAVRTPGLLKYGSTGEEVWSLQTTLRGLGYRDADGQPLKADSDFGNNTDKAVRDFQRAHGLEPVDGKVGKDTRAALVRAAEQPLVSEATHPNHKLYAAIGSQLPAGTDPKAIANVTMQALENSITGPDRVGAVQVRGSDVTVFSTTPGFRPQVDLAAPTPDLQSMSDHMARQTAERTQDDQRRQQLSQQPQFAM